MNDEQRAALIHLLQTVMEISYERGQQRSHYNLADEAKRLADVIEDDFLADRAATVGEPDADAVEAVAKAIWEADPLHVSREAWETWDAIPDEWREEHRVMARAAISAMPSGKDAEWLDDALDSVGADDIIVQRTRHPRNDIDWEHPGYTFCCDLWSHENYDDPNPDPISSGTGTTRREAILDAVQKAKEARGEGDS